MTMPEERYLAVVLTREFLVRLVTGKARPLPVVKDEARKLLKHYPARFEMEWAAAQAPKVFEACPTREGDTVKCALARKNQEFKSQA